jgi:hypothetical protein
MDVAAAVRQGARGVSWFVKGMLGEDAYEKYLEHVAPELALGHDVADRQDRNPQSRCC